MVTKELMNCYECILTGASDIYLICLKRRKISELVQVLANSYNVLHADFHGGDTDSTSVRDADFPCVGSRSREAEAEAVRAAHQRTRRRLSFFFAPEGFRYDFSK